MAPPIVPPRIRLALLSIEGDGATLRDYLNTLSTSHQSASRTGYFPDFPGFEAIFKTMLEIPQRRSGPVAVISRASTTAALAGPEPERAFLALLEDAIRQLMLRRAEFDVLAIYLPPVLEPIFRVAGEAYEFDLHDATKAVTATRGIPSQIVLDRSIGYPDRCSVLWSLGVALYAKAGGIPWMLGDRAPGVAFVGLSYVLKRIGQRQSVVTCCSQLFDDRGQGLQFLLFTADDFTLHGRNPFLCRTDARRLLSKTVELYVRQAGERPRRLVVYKTIHFTKEEREGIADALAGLDNYELLQVQEATAWSAVKGERRRPTGYPVDRGLALPLSKFAYLLWTQGDVVGATGKGRSYYQEGKGIPNPLLVTQHAGSMPLEESAAELSGLTKMNWNTGRLYNNMPVTLTSASKLGRIAKYMSTVSQTPYQARLFM